MAQVITHAQPGRATARRSVMPWRDGRVRIDWIDDNGAIIATEILRADEASSFAHAVHAAAQTHTAEPATA